jgi:UDP-3-O-[3-hydroxymyristoyl] glucosamine N-acyltransferase
MPIENIPDSELLELVGKGKRFEALGLTNSKTPGTLTFLDTSRFLKSLLENRNNRGAFVSEALASAILEQAEEVTLLLRQDPRRAFYSLHNELAGRESVVASPTKISSDAVIHPTAYVAEFSVEIGSGVTIEPRAVILPGVKIGADSIIRAGAVLGVEGFEHKRTMSGILSVRHDAGVVIGNRVEIGANNTVAKGLLGVDTVVGDDTKTDCLVYIGHAARIGRRCLLPACAMIAGSAVIGDDVWIGPNASVSSQIVIGDGAFVTLGAVVTRNVEAGGRVSGNFAIEHDLFLSRLKASLKKSAQE